MANPTGLHLSDLWMSSLAGSRDSHAQTSASLAKGLESLDRSPAYGSKWSESLARFDQDTCSWRTHQRCLDGEWELFSETFPRWGMMRGGECWALTTLVRRTGGTGSGLWPTPRASEGNQDYAKLTRSSTGISLPTAVQLYPTPNSRDWKDSGPTQGNRKSPNLGTVVHGGMRTRPTNPGQLNPNWVEWLMGVPIGFTDSRPSETCKSQRWLRLHGRY